MMLPGLPIIIRPRKRCPRCGLKSLKKLDYCPHCRDLADGPELEALKQQQQARLEAGSQLGNTFLIITALGIILLLILAL